MLSGKNSNKDNLIMNGIINVLKPAGMTSFDVVSFLRKTAGQKKIGHTGTLDPSAVGVLPVCLGNATKAIEFMIDKDKVYRAELVLGITTDTQDTSGKVLSTTKPDVSDKQITDTIMGFVGQIEQLPPMYSAIKINGKKLYDLAREGIEVDRQARKITIFDIEVLRIWDDNITKKVLMNVHCSKGTYIRTLCNDIGNLLGCGGCMSFLVRTKAGNFDISSAYTVEQIAEMAQNQMLEKILVPVETQFENLASIRLNDKESFKYCNGGWIEASGENGTINRIYDNDNRFLGIGEIFAGDGCNFLRSKKFFIKD
jgi:tRNA pseudouridine55 synthase